MVYVCPLCKEKHYARGGAVSHMTLSHPGIHEEIIYDNQTFKGFSVD